jgi:hypothetical protein
VPEATLTNDHRTTGPARTERTGATAAAPPPTLTIRAWWDPTLADRGHDPRGDYVERFWLGVVGPSTILLLRRFARGLEVHPSGFRVGLVDTARALGLGTGTGRNSPMVRTIDRARAFGLARELPDGDLAVRTSVPTLPRRHVQRLPEPLQRAHAAWLAEHTAHAGASSS